MSDTVHVVRPASCIPKYNAPEQCRCMLFRFCSWPLTQNIWSRASGAGLLDAALLAVLRLLKRQVKCSFQSQDLYFNSELLRYFNSILQWKAKLRDAWGQ